MRIKQLKLLRFLPTPLAVRVVIALLATRRLVTAVRGRRPQNLSAQQRAAAVVELRRLVPAPRPKSLGGERIGTDTYERFLSVVEWQPERAAPMLKADLVWRARVKPRACRPEHIPKACAQSGWQVLMVGGGTAESEAPPSSPNRTLASAAASSVSSVSWYRRWYRKALLSRSPKARPLHPPHYKPRGVQWRYTKHGLPITLIEVRSWFPERAGAEETATHAAYMMVTLTLTRTRTLTLALTLALNPKPDPGRDQEHYIRRMPQRGGQHVTRCCLLLDMRGFRHARRWG